MPTCYACGTTDDLTFINDEMCNDMGSDDWDARFTGHTCADCNPICV